MGPNATAPRVMGPNAGVPGAMGGGAVVLDVVGIGVAINGPWFRRPWSRWRWSTDITVTLLWCCCPRDAVATTAVAVMCNGRGSDTSALGAVDDVSGAPKRIEPHSSPAVPAAMMMTAPPRAVSAPYVAYVVVCGGKDAPPSQNATGKMPGDARVRRCVRLSAFSCRQQRLCERPKLSQNTQPL